jgi:hypothetical protein
MSMGSLSIEQPYCCVKPCERPVWMSCPGKKEERNDVKEHGFIILR